jgi:hypothetical protein
VKRADALNQTNGSPPNFRGASFYNRQDLTPSIPLSVYREGKDDSGGNSPSLRAERELEGEVSSANVVIRTTQESEVLVTNSV